MTILDISDYHGQLIPLTETADNLGAPAVNPSFSIGGSAFLKRGSTSTAPRRRGRHRSLMAAGDSVGATPPISNFFGDKPTIEIMNLMGIDLDGVGNHNFDRGEEYLRNELIPLADFPFISANVVDAERQDAAGVVAVEGVQLRHGVKVGFVGFTKDDAPTSFPGGLGPFQVAARPAVNAEAAKLEPRRSTRSSRSATGCNRRVAHRPDRAADRHRGRVDERRRRDRRPHRLPGAHDVGRTACW